MTEHGILAIDIGNTHTVAGFFSGSKVVRHWRWRTEPGATADELAVLAAGLFGLAGLEHGRVGGIVMASVVPQLDAAWRECCRSLFGRDPMTVTSDTDTGIRIATETPSEVGADRLVNSAAAWARFSCALIVVDFGTATTFDCVSAAGEYLGGAIAPGIGISLAALRSRTAKLPRVDISRAPERAIGTNTETAIASGVVHGYAGLTRGLIERLAAEMESRPMVVATGGLARLIAPHVPGIDTVAPLLTLEGLRLIHERNR